MLKIGRFYEKNFFINYKNVKKLAFFQKSKLSLIFP